MRRILNGSAAYLAGLAGQAARGWDAFVFAPADPTPLGLIRLAVGLLAAWSLFVFGLDLADYFGPDAWATVQAVQAVQGTRYPFAWSLWFYVPDGWIWPAWGVGMAVLLMFAAGLFSRVTAVLAWVVVVSTVRRVPVALYGFDQIVTTLIFYLAVTGSSGQAVSLDRFLARWRSARAQESRRRDGRKAMAWPSGVPAATVSANLGLRLIQLHLCLIYGMAGLAKLQGPAWWDGTAIWGTLAAGEFRLFDLTWLAAYPWLINALTHAGLAMELSYPVLVWVRPVRPLVLAGAVALHVAAELTLGLGEFGAAMVAANLAFCSGAWLRSLVTGREGSPGSAPARLLYDGACPRCRASLALVTAADPGRVVEPMDLTAVDVTAVHPTLTREACLRTLHLVRPDGRVVAGFDAVTALGRMLPLFWPLGVVGALPGVCTAGRRVYNALAASRPRDVPCTDEVCRPPERPGAARPAPHVHAPPGPAE